MDREVTRLCTRLLYLGSAPVLGNRSFRVTANVTIPENGASGMLFTQGGFTAGWALYIQDQKLVGVHNLLGIERFRLEATDSVPTGKGILLTPLSQWGKNYIPPATSPTDPSVDDKTPPLVQVSKLDGVAMLTRLAELMKRYPPHANDCPILFRMRAFGIEPGKDFDPGKLDAATTAAINEGSKQALADMAKRIKTLGTRASAHGPNIARGDSRAP